MSNTESGQRSEIKMNGDIANSELSYDEKVKWQEIRWKNRRRMAWGSFWNLTIIVLLYFFAPITETRLDIIADPLSMICFCFVGVIGAYMGFTAIEKMKLGK